MYISKEVVDFRKDCPTVAEAEAKVRRMVGPRTLFMAGSGVLSPILVCELGAKKRGLNLEVAAADARHWWQTGLVPLRPTPAAGEVDRSRSAEESEETQSKANPSSPPKATPQPAPAGMLLAPPGDGNLFRFQCPHCAKHLKGSPQLVGRKVNCPKCGKSITVPSSGGPSLASPRPAPQGAGGPSIPVGKGAAGDSHFLRFACPQCKKWLGTDPSHSGKKATCPKCGHKMVVPRPEECRTGEAGTQSRAGIATERNARVVPAAGVGAAVQELATQAKNEGWNLFGSVTVECHGCGKAYEPKKHFLDRRILQLVPKGGLGTLYDLDKPFPCPECKAETMTIRNIKILFQDWLRTLCDALERSQDDPSIGFEDLESGGLVKDHHLQAAMDFDELWERIGARFDSAGSVNANGGFDAIWSRSDWRKVRGCKCLIHFHDGTKEQIRIIKGSRGNLWYWIEQK
jgi:ribosomal protein S27E